MVTPLSQPVAVNGLCQGRGQPREQGTWNGEFAILLPPDFSCLLGPSDCRAEILPLDSGLLGWGDSEVGAAPGWQEKQNWLATWTQG